MTEKKKTTNLVTPMFRGSFVHLTKARTAAEGAAPKYSIVVILPQDDKEAMAFLKKLQAQCDKVVLEKFGGKKPKKLASPFRDGDEEDRPEWEGCITFNASASEDFKPSVVDADLQPIMDPAELYSGAYYRASLRPYAWDHPVGGKGYSIGLVNVQKLKDGEPFASVTKAEDDFSPWTDDDE